MTQQLVGGRPMAQATVVDGVDVVGSLSPSRAGDFMTCPLLYRFRTVDRLPETSSPEAVRGTVVHKVLEELFDLPAAERTPERAAGMLEPAWEAVLAEDPEIAELFGADGPEIGSWLVSCRQSLERYFTLEDPRWLEPAEREMYVETLLDSRLLLRGFVDRLDVAPTGEVRVVDYKGLAVDTPLPTPGGWTTMGEVQVGDLVFGRDGRPTRVTVKSDVHHRPCYRITFRDGSSVVCDNVHLWTVVTSYRQQQTTETLTADAVFERHRRLAALGRPSSIWVDAAEALDLDDCEVPTDPWLLGAWLGDGDTRGNGFTVGKLDLDDMLTQFKERWPRTVLVREAGSSFRVTLSRFRNQCTFGHHEFREPTPGHPTRRCAREDTHSGLSPWNVPFGAELARAGVRGHKHIPPVYLRAGRQQRIDLLRGLMDTDGWWDEIRRRAGFTTTSDRLAADVIELLRTLGQHPMHFVKPHTNAIRPGRNWHVIEFTPHGFNPFALPRKAQAAETGVTPLQEELTKRRVVAKVEPVASVPTQCIAVDAADSLYLCGEGFVPTHNTGKSPGPMFEAKALFQMKFYALVLWRLTGRVPDLLQLIYLGNGEVLRYAPDEADLRATERKVEAIWRAIARAAETGDWRPRKSALCGWCSHQALCPEFGGTPPPLPVLTRADVADPGLSSEDTD